MYCTPSEAVASARSVGTGGSAHGAGGATTVNVPVVERSDVQPSCDASTDQLTAPCGTVTPRNCGVAEVAATLLPRKRRYCVAPGTAAAEKSTGETSDAPSAGATRIGVCGRQFCGRVDTNRACAESVGSQPLKSVRMKNSSAPAATVVWNEGEVVEATIDGVAPES